MEGSIRGREIELFNDLARLEPLGTLSASASSICRFPSPEPDAPDGWLWLPPGSFPEDWHWLDHLARLNTIRLTYRFSEGFCTVRVYGVTGDVRKVHTTNTSKAKAAFRRLLSEVDTAPDHWYTAGIKSTPRRDLLGLGRDATLAQIYNTLESPSGHLPDQDLTPHEQYAVQAIRTNQIPGLVSQLYPYQARSVQSMLLREMYPAQILDPRILKVCGPTGKSLYLDPDQCCLVRYPSQYDAPLGGILAEEMGSGKTCESLALILVSLDQMPVNPALSPGVDLRMPLVESSKSSGVRTLRDIAAQIAQSAAVPSRWHDLSQNCVDLLDAYRPSYIVPPPPLRTRARKLITDANGRRVMEPDTRPGTQIWLSHATLVVVPDTLVSQWRHEITKHVQSEVLRVLVISSTSNKLRDKIPPLEELSKFDVVLISHSRFSREEKQIGVFQRCECTYSGKTRTVFCNCPPPVSYVSPLTSIHWKRLIVDEGHSMSSSHTKAVRFASSLRVERKWVVSGTPSRGLVGASADGQEGTQDERFDLDRLCTTMIDFLGLQALDRVTWKKYITKPFLEQALGSELVVRNLLNSMIVRNRQSDIQKDVVLPPLTKKVIYLDATAETVLSQNIFNALIAINAVTSQRIDQDYFFHKSQTGPLQAVVRNMLVSTFHWTGTSLKDIDGALSVAKQALLVNGPTYSSDDRRILQDSIGILEEAKSSDQWLQTSEKHELGYYFSQALPEEARQYYLLSGSTPAVLGGTAVIGAQHVVKAALTKSKTDDVSSDEYLTHALISEGIKGRAREEKEREQTLKRNWSREQNTSGKNSPKQSPTGGSIRKIAVARASTKLVAQRNKQITQAADDIVLAGEDLGPSPATNGSPTKEISPVKHMIQASAELASPERRKVLADAASLSSIRITSTSSAKLNYVLSQIQLYSRDEKIIIFSDFVDHTYHLAEALDIIGVPYLLYTSSLKPMLKNRYILTFNTSETFRVMIMDLQLAAHGLNLSTASRVYFVQQCWSGAIESQAIKRAHRIGQTRPVEVEILVLRGSIEEAIHRRRMNLTGKEIGDTKLITDDNVIRSAIKNPKFLSRPETRMLLDPTFPLFYIGDGSGVGDQGLAPIDPEDLSPTKPLRKSNVADLSSSMSRSCSPIPAQLQRPAKRARFSDASAMDSEAVADPPGEVNKLVKFEDEGRLIHRHSSPSGSTPTQDTTESEPTLSMTDHEPPKKVRKTIRFAIDAA